jgi:LacI family transcriptional regulator
MATIKEVARKARVSVATVSYVLNMKTTETISQPVTKRVLAAAQRLNYRPNHLARSLVLRKTCTLGVISDSLSNTFFYEILAGVQRVASSKGYALLLGVSDLSVAREAQQVEFMLDRRVDGLVIVTVADGGHCAHIESLRRDRIPFVLVDERIIGLECDYVMSENAKGARQAIAHLLSLGHRRIGFIGNDCWRKASTTVDRLEGYKSALAEAGLSFDPELVCYLPKGREEEELRHFLSEEKDLSAVFLTSDSMAPWVFTAADQLGLKIPRCLAVVGFDDSAAAATMPVPLTTVRQPRTAMGKRAAEVLLYKLANSNEGLLQIQMPTELVVRTSCGRGVRIWDTALLPAKPVLLRQAESPRGSEGLA